MDNGQNSQKQAHVISKKPGAGSPDFWRARCVSVGYGLAMYAGCGCALGSFVGGILLQDKLDKVAATHGISDMIVWAADAAVIGASSAAAAAVCIGSVSLLGKAPNPKYAAGSFLAAVLATMAAFPTKETGGGLMYLPGRLSMKVEQIETPNRPAVLDRVVMSTPAPVYA